VGSGRLSRSLSRSRDEVPTRGSPVVRRANGRARQRSSWLPARNGTFSLYFRATTGPTKTSSAALGCRRRWRRRSEEATAGLAASMLLASTSDKLMS
jgi:hypothetical protein